MSELGYMQRGGTSPISDDNWELRWPYSERVYTKMLREDAQVKAVVNAVSLPIRRATYRIDPNGAAPEVVARVAEDLRLPVLGESSAAYSSVAGRISWSEHLQKALLALVYGHAFFEQVYKTDENGEEHLVKLAPRLAGSISKINVARDGGLESIEQHGDNGEIITIPVNRLVAYCFEPTDATWVGTSILRAAYKHWVLADRLMRKEVVILDRNGMGVPVYTGAETAADPQQDLEQGMQITRSLRAGAETGVSVPFGAKLEIKGVSGQLVSPRQAIEAHQSMMAKSVLAHFLNLDGAGGSYALAETQADLFVQSLQTIAEWITDTATLHIVGDLVKVAFPEYRGAIPRVMCDPIASKKDITAEAIANLVNAGVIYMDPATEEYVRRRFTMPSKQPFEKKEQQNE